MKLCNGHTSTKEAGEGKPTSWSKLWVFECGDGKTVLQFNNSDPFRAWTYCPYCGKEIRKDKDVTTKN